MFANIVKWICMSTLVIAALLRVEEGSRILLQLVICGGAVFVMMLATRSRRFLWMLPFGLVTIYFNPILPIKVSRPAELPVLLASLVLFAVSLRYLPAVPRMSLATITDLPARGESL